MRSRAAVSVMPAVWVRPSAWKNRLAFSFRRSSVRRSKSVTEERRRKKWLKSSSRASRVSSSSEKRCSKSVSCSERRPRRRRISRVYSARKRVLYSSPAAWMSVSARLITSGAKASSTPFSTKVGSSTFSPAPMSSPMLSPNRTRFHQITDGWFLYE